MGSNSHVMGSNSHGSQFSPSLQQIEVDYLSALLEGSSPDPVAAHCLLDGLAGDGLRLQVCELVLSQCSDVASLASTSKLEVVVFVLHYLLSRLGHCLQGASRQTYCNKLLGAKVGYIAL